MYVYHIFILKIFKMDSSSSETFHGSARKFRSLLVNEIEITGEKFLKCLGETIR